MKEQKYHLYLSKDEYSEVLQSLIRLKNSLIAQGRYSTKEIAPLVHLTTGAIYARLDHLRKKLRKIL